jgi:hypothetical protein
MFNLANLIPANYNVNLVAGYPANGRGIVL